MKNSRLLDLEQLVRDDSVRLEMTGGVPTWEAFPGVLHQETIDLIRASIQHYAPITLDFLCGSRCTVPDMRSEAL